jgi:hypothetical protein
MSSEKIILALAINLLLSIVLYNDVISHTDIYGCKKINVRCAGENKMFFFSFIDLVSFSTILVNISI